MCDATKAKRHNISLFPDEYGHLLKNSFLCSVMRLCYVFFGLCAAIGLMGCATASSPGASVVSSAPVMTSTPISKGIFAATLSLCDGDHIDNAPTINARKNIVQYDPYAYVSGVTLVRAPVRRACFSSGFGNRHDRTGLHKGIDLSTGHPHAVYAAGDGVIEEMRTTIRYGNMILIRHNNDVKTRYAHLSSFGSKMHLGHDVRQGDIIGKTGKTGNANAVILHYEIIVGGTPQDPMTIGR